MSLWRRIWNIVRPGPLMCSECGDAVFCTHWEYCKGIVLARYECAGCGRKTEDIG